MHLYHLQAHWNCARLHLRKREKGVCRACGTNTHKLRSSLIRLWKVAVQIGGASQLLQNLCQLAIYNALGLAYRQLAEELSQLSFYGFMTQLPISCKPRKAWKKPSDS